MALQICLRMDEKFNKFEHNFAGLGMEMAELHKEYAKLRAEIARKEVEFCGQIVLKDNELKKLREQNGILTSRLMNNVVEEREPQVIYPNKRYRIFDPNAVRVLDPNAVRVLDPNVVQRVLDPNVVQRVLDPNAVRVQQQQQQNAEVAMAIQEEIPITRQHEQPLEESNNTENQANIQYTAPNNGIDNGIPIIKQEKDVVEVIGICPGTSSEHEIAPQQNVEQNQANPMDELNNETSADGFGQAEEYAFTEEGDETVAGTSMEMDGTSPTVREYLRERMDEFYDDDALAQPAGPSNIGIVEQGPSNVSNDQNGQQQSGRRKIKMKNLNDMPMPIQYSFRMEMHLDNQLICQWPGCGYRRNSKYKSDMQRHWRTHTGERPYCCSICGQSFARLDNMKKHELTQHSLL